MLTTLSNKAANDFDCFVICLLLRSVYYSTKELMDPLGDLQFIQATLRGFCTGYIQLTDVNMVRMHMKVCDQQPHQINSEYLLMTELHDVATFLIRRCVFQYGIDRILDGIDIVFFPEIDDLI